MDAIEAIMSRRSVRSYLSDEIPEDDLKTILEAARQAPSAANRQPWHMVVVRNPGLRHQVAEACNGQAWIGGAAAVVAGVALPSVNAKWCVVDLTIAMENLVLAAAALGYGTCWIGAFREDDVKRLLGIPEDAKVVALTPLGKPVDRPAARGRKAVEELFSWERYSR